MTGRNCRSSWRAPLEIAGVALPRYHNNCLIIAQEADVDHSEGFLKIVNDAKSRVRETTPEEVRRKQEAGEKFHFIDVREDNEWEAAHAQGATHLGKGIIERDIEKAIPDHDAEVILYCGGGYRSALAADVLQQMGYRNVISMDGGWKRWKELGYPTENE
jgi:rhodanese-related sulfurtransferase